MMLYWTESCFMLQYNQTEEPSMAIRTPLIASSLIAASLISGAAHAGLIGRDLNGSAGSFEAYYDTDLNITWLANANVNGLMNWANANIWAASLSFTDGTNVYDNWRLPTTLQPDVSCGSQSVGGVSHGYNCTGSEMGHLFYSELGGTAGQPILSSADPDVAKFTNLQASHYWSGTEYVLSTGGAWLFNFFNGNQTALNESSGFYALAVSPGDVGAANGNTVPEPQTLALVGLGLLGLAVARRRG